MTTTRIILVSFIVDTGNSQLPIRTTMLYLLGRGGVKTNVSHTHIRQLFVL